jgi:quinol monooxygenase YgiN
MKSILVFTLITLSIMSGTNTMAQGKNSNTQNHSIEIIRYSIPADQHSNFEEAYREAGKLLDASPYCLGYQVIHGEEEPNHYIVIIDWTSTQEHLDGFRKSQQFMPFFNLVKPFYNNIEEMKHYKEAFQSSKP